MIEVNVIDFGAEDDGISDDTQAFLDAINTLPEEGGQLYIPEGSYLIKLPLSIDKSILFKGEGANKTRLFFNLAKQNKNCIEFLTNERGDWVDILSGYTKGSQKLVVNDPGRFQPYGFG